MPSTRRMFYNAKIKSLEKVTLLYGYPIPMPALVTIPIHLTPTRQDAAAEVRLGLQNEFIHDCVVDV
ncbi:hypothetical protein BOTBODRAFT_182162 [Botryobasidium botryosum FD-172 SS1]|uniref:Uncharacterized protein n=1 Tax=Botryobasidium botryosum (strain FD-172 SS1) TaxID=930990 RepID=A0A067LS71_BOTB1|nr:hypothetical protein BOTBODRAFT_182162 [Botryobasidium botryosum FD-172 SS1]